MSYPYHTVTAARAATVGLAMVGSLNQLAAVAALSLSVAACATGPSDYYGDGGYGASVSGGRIIHQAQPLECVAYAREHSSIAIYGDAYTWWDQAAGHYGQTKEPTIGAVLVLDRYAGPYRAHLAVVRSVVSGREIRVDHANWLDRGDIHLNDPVVDVSPANDWSQVRVFNLETDAWGGRVYDVRGFIAPASGAMEVANGD